MSPEVLRGKAPDFNADLWSLCVVLYETVLGAHPFYRQGAAAATVLEIVRGQYARPAGDDERLVAALDRFFARAFARSLRRRPRRASDLRAMLLELAAATAGVSARAARRADPATLDRRPAASSAELPTETSDRA
jgi:serine/threonine protein kinase